MQRVKISARIPQDLDDALTRLTALDPDLTKSAVLVRLARIGLAASQARPGTPVHPLQTSDTAWRAEPEPRASLSESGR